MVTKQLVFWMEATIDIAPIGTRPRNNRSAVSNGRRTFAADGDGRSVWTRRWRDLVLAHLSDLGGEQIASAAQVALVAQQRLRLSLNAKDAVGRRISRYAAATE